jgi:hypothetical protein
MKREIMRHLTDRAAMAGEVMYESVQLHLYKKGVMVSVGWNRLHHFAEGAPTCLLAH